MSENPNAILWAPDEARVNAAQMTRFRQAAEALSGQDLADYHALHRWSVEQPEVFWSLLWDFCDVKALQRGERVLVDGDRFPGARWFPDARLNFAENLLWRDDDHPALISLLENGCRRSVSYRELRQQVAACAQGLRQSGINAGDRVAAMLPNTPEAIVGMLACASIGAVWSSCSPDFGAAGVLDRFRQIEPRLLLATDAYRYNGKRIDCGSKIAEIQAGLPGLDKLVIVPFTDGSDTETEFNGAVSWDELLEDGAELVFEPLPFDHPLSILYSSGTTGAPKCIVHSAGGTLLQHLKEHRLHTDINEQDVVFYFTTCGWMMWNWLASGLATGCSLVLYDGAPLIDDGKPLLDAIDNERISVFGTSAKFIAALEKTGSIPRETHKLTSLKTVLSTGSPLSHESFAYVYRDIKADICLSSISGGTDIVSCFILGNPLLPVRQGEIQCAGLGMGVAVLDDNGQPVVGQRGELACTRPFPSCPLGFWNDKEGERFRQAYFSRWPATWAHGDFAEVTPSGGFVIHGRSDAVLNPGGVRIGTAEIYRQVEQLPEILESIVVGQNWKDDVRVVLFVVLRPDLSLDESLATRIRKQVRQHCSPRHVPAKILQVTDIPRTRSGKIVELAVRSVIHGESVNNTEALANPGALAQFRGLAALTED